MRIEPQKTFAVLKSWGGCLIVMVPVRRRDVAILSIAAVLSAILYRYWLITSVLNHLSKNQWRAVAIGIAVLVGALWALTKWNLSTLVSGFMMGILAGGTWTFLPVSHAFLADAFKSNLESFGGEMIAFTIAVTLGGYCSSRFAKSRRQLRRHFSEEAHSKDR